MNNFIKTLKKYSESFLNLKIFKNMIDYSIFFKFFQYKFGLLKCNYNLTT